MTTMTRKVIGIGETILDILFKNDQPTAAVPGGSTFNSIISLGRMGVPTVLLSETGNDRVGRTILRFMEENGVDTSHVYVYPENKSAISLAFLNERNEAEYLFYKDYSSQRLDTFPKVTADDIILFGSYFALNPVLRPKVSDFLNYARHQGALIYYDLNFRSTHANDAIKLMPIIIENMELADIVRGSSDDFRNMYGMEDPNKIYTEKIMFYCPRLIATAGAKSISLFANNIEKQYTIPPIQTVSTVGAGDNFNAGIIYGLLKYDIRRDDLASLDIDRWNNVMQCALDFAEEACRNIGNNISCEFAARYKAQ